MTTATIKQACIRVSISEEFVKDSPEKALEHLLSLATKAGNYYVFSLEADTEAIRRVYPDYDPKLHTFTVSRDETSENQTWDDYQDNWQSIKP